MSRKPSDYQKLLLGAAKEVNQFTASSESSWEYEVVRQLCISLDVPRDVKDSIHRFGERETGRARLLIAGFLKEVQFPYYLETAVLKNASARCQLGHIFSKPADREFIVRYSEARSNRPDKRQPAVLIAKWPYLPGGAAVHQLGAPERGSYLVLAATVPVIVEPWSQMLARIRECLQ